MRSPSILVAIAALAWASPAAADVTVFEAPKVADFRLDMYGWIQPRLAVQEHDDRPGVNFDPNPAFTVQRARMGTVATMGPWARAQVELELAGQFASTLDAYVVLSPVHEKVASLNLTVGQFRVPFSRQNLLPSVGYQLPDTAYFVASSFIVDRDIGGMIWSELFEGRLKLEIGMFNGNVPARGQTVKTDPDFLYAARLEVAPFGKAPRFEGDLRPLGMQHRFLMTLGASAMKHKANELNWDRNWVGADLAAYWEGASLYGEFYYHVDSPLPAMPGAMAVQGVRQIGFNVQVGYFPPIPWVREHLEPAFRVEYFDPAIDVTHPNGDSGSRDLNQSNPTWGYLGYVVGLNYFLNHRHTLKAQVSYEIRDETKPCLQGQTTQTGCTGTINNNLFLAQITAGF
jgi:hypothetical protein